MKSVIFLVCWVVAIQASILKSEHQQEWEKFLDMYKKEYNSDTERNTRFHIFVDNAIKVTEHNKEYEAGKKPFMMGINKFADMLDSEISSNIIPSRTTMRLSHSLRTGNIASQAPESIDWREKGAVTPVKDEGHCSANWAFSSAGAIEGQLSIKAGKLIAVSEQNLMDCTWDYGNAGCGGGWIDGAFQYVIDNKGIDTEESYPYEARDHECTYDPANSEGYITSYDILPQGDEEALKQSVGTIGPVTVTLNAGSPEFKMYRKGIFVSDNCPAMMTHSMLVVGYGTEDGQDYWILKNSWGTSWGEEGYMRMARNYNNMCGIAMQPIYAVA